MNAREELLSKVSIDDIDCSMIEYVEYKWMYKKYTDKKKTIALSSSGDRDAFLKQLDFEYNDGFGTQELFGIVWLKDGTWLERAEYDGSEWWKHKEQPEIPEILLH